MKHVFPAWLTGLLVLAIVMFPVYSARAQTPAASPTARTIQESTLGIAQGNGYVYVTDGAGNAVNTAVLLVDNGSFDPQAPPEIRDLYTDLGVESLYWQTFFLVPEAPRSEEEATIGISVEMRITWLTDDAAAERFVGSFLELLQQAAGVTDVPVEIEPVTDLPEHAGAITGFTWVDQYVNNLATPPVQAWVPFTRLIAQEGTMVASVKVTSLDPAFNDAAARELLARQLDCLASETACEPVPLPGEVRYEPGTPIATPAAVASPSRSRAAVA